MMSPGSPTYDMHAGEEKKMDDGVLSSSASGNEDSSVIDSKSPPMTNLGEKNNASGGSESFLISPSTTCGSAKRNISGSKFATMFGTLTRALFLDLPLIVLFSLYIASIGLEQIGTEYLLPQLELQRFTPEKAESDLTYYHRVCDATDQTAHDTSELVVTPEMSTDAAVNVMLTHGAAALPNLLSPETAHELREFILAENKISRDLIYVIENANRWSFPMQVDQHPSVPKALREVLQKPQLVELLEAVIGPNPAVIEFTAITSAYGAVGQYWHQDVVPEGSAAKYSRNFIPSYSLFIPLQNTTAAMGATGLCPGTHMCAEGAVDVCPDTAFQVSGRNDNWPLGMGALLNQQTTHRGEAHTDPQAPHRVVFIVTFAPRPQTAAHTVETRMIGVSGSYSLHYSQWGHTLKEFQQPDRRVSALPWRMARSLGLYKPPGSQWGWDYVTVCSCRIANEDTGFTSDDLEQFLENGGFKWLPKSLHGEQNDDESSLAWVSFLQDTVSKCQEALKQAHRSVLAVYVVVLLFTALVSGGSRWSKILKTKFRLVIFHLAVLLIAGWIKNRIDKSTWARNIQNKRSFSLPKTLALTPDLPGKIPNKNDILILEGMQSAYFGSFTKVLEVSHPGNKAWHAIVSRYANDFSSLSPELQQQVFLSVLLEARQQYQRILLKNTDGNWAAAPIKSYVRFCHKSIVQHSKPLTGAVSQTLDFLLSEARFGYWRDTVMHKRFVPLMLTALQDEILGIPATLTTEKKSLASMLVSSSWTARPHRPISSGLPKLPKDTRAPFAVFKRQPIPISPLCGEPHPGAWIQEGDIVEAVLNGDFSEWYRGLATYASSNRLVWEIEFDDGDIETDLPANAIRAYVPYHVDEIIEVRLDEVTYVEGKVVAVNTIDDTFVIEVEASGEIFSDVHPMNLRRREGSRPKNFAIGDRVQAKFPDAGDEYYLGTVAAIHRRGVDIAYDDGDYIENLPLQMVEPIIN